MTPARSSATVFGDRVARYQLAFGIVASLVGAAAFVHARDLGFTASKGATLGWGSYELTLMSYNRLGALVTLGLGLVGVAGGLRRSTRLGAVPAVGFAIIFVLGLVQVRPQGANLFGSNPQTMAFSLAMLLGFVVTAALSDAEPEPDRSRTITHPEES